MTLLSFVAIATVPATASAEGDIKELKLRDWQPRSMLKTKITLVKRPRFPAIDVHNHLYGTDPQAAISAMDEAGVKAVVNLDGGWGKALVAQLKRFDQAYPGRFLTFALIDFRNFDDSDWSERIVAQLEADFRAGAKGLKFHKALGLGYRHRDGSLIRVDDPKLDPIWALCARYRRPVMIHTADPAALLYTARSLQRTMARTQRAPRLAVLWRSVSKSRRTLEAAQPSYCQTSKDDLHWRAPWQQSGGSSDRREVARSLS